MKTNPSLLLKRNPMLYDILLMLRAYSALSEKAETMGKPFELSCKALVAELINSNKLYESMEYPFLEAELFLSELHGKELGLQIFIASPQLHSHEKDLKELLEVIGDWDDSVVSDLLETARLSYGIKETGKSQTPNDLASLMVEIACIGSKGGSVSDQCCGLSSLLFKAEKRLPSPKIFMQDINESTIRMAVLMAIIEKIDLSKLSVHQGNLLIDDGFPDERFDLQISQPPFAIRYSSGLKERLKSDPRFSPFKTLPRSSQADLLFVENVIFHMKPDTGRAVIMCAPSIMAQGSVNGQIREEVIRRNLVDAVIKIPQRTLYDTTMATYLLVLDGGKKKSDVLFIDAEPFFSKIEDRWRKMEITDEGIQKLISAYKARQNVIGKCCITSLKEIETNEFSLSMEKYVLRRKLEKILKKEALKDFEDVAEVIVPRIIRSKSGKRLSADACKSHPFDYEKTSKGPATTVIVHKGDLIFKSGILEMLYLFDEEPKEEVFATERDIVIRPKSIQSEYLYYYFKSETGRMAFSINTCSNLGLQILTRVSFEGLKIPLPRNNPEEYRRTFEIENHLKIDIASFNALLANKNKYLDDTFEDVLSQELAIQVKRYKAEAMAEFLSDDIRELNACFHSKAYKATLILAGSILEAVLIDWISEKEGVDYFTNDYMVPDRRGGRKRADLFDYINVLKELEKPNWDREANMAHAIRTNRNLVHAKLGIKSEDINEHTCKMVIRYLRTVLETRGVTIRS